MLSADGLWSDYDWWQKSKRKKNRRKMEEQKRLWKQMIKMKEIKKGNDWKIRRTYEWKKK